VYIPDLFVLKTFFFLINTDVVVILHTISISRIQVRLHGAQLAIQILNVNNDAFSCVYKDETVFFSFDSLGFL